MASAYQSMKILWNRWKESRRHRVKGRERMANTTPKRKRAKWLWVSKAGMLPSKYHLNLDIFVDVDVKEADI